MRFLEDSLLFRRKANLDEFEAEAVLHLNDLYRTAVRLMGNPTHADDVIQETYLKAWKSFHQFRKGTNCRAWLFRIMFNAIHDHRRRWFNVKVVGEEEAQLETKLPYAPPVPDKLADEEILGALDELPSNYREAVLLADVEEFAYKDIAKTLGVPIGTVMSRLSRGRKLLRTTLAGVAGTYGIGTPAKGGQTA